MTIKVLFLPLFKNPRQNVSLFKNPAKMRDAKKNWRDWLGGKVVSREAKNKPTPNQIPFIIVTKMLFFILEKKL